MSQSVNEPTIEQKQIDPAEERNQARQKAKRLLPEREPSA
jgi:hypothetical protein